MVHSTTKIASLSYPLPLKPDTLFCSVPILFCVQMPLFAYLREEEEVYCNVAILTGIAVPPDFISLPRNQIKYIGTYLGKL